MLHEEGIPPYLRILIYRTVGKGMEGEWEGEGEEGEMNKKKGGETLEEGNK